MGASDSKLFWELPESSEDVFSLFTPADIRRTRDRALENLETLILAITSRLFILRHHPSFPDPELAPEREALNCIRVLTRILPYLYEKESLSDWEQQFFWAQRRKRTRHGAIANEILFDEAQEAERKTQTAEFEEVKPLAEELVDTLVDLLFFSDLTLPRQPNGRPKVSYAIWQSGTLKYNPATWRVPYNTLVFKDGKQMLVTYSLQFLLVLLLYPIPENPSNPSPKHSYRHFLGRLHRPQDFQFIVDGMTRILNQPLQEKTSYLPGSQSPGHFAPEILMLFWEILQCNKRFRSFIVDTERAHDFVVLALFYALEYKNDATKQGVVRMCAFLLQTLSVETNFGVNLNKYFEGQESLPTSIRVPGFRGTYADFLIHSIYNLITTSQGKLSAIYPALLAVINNIAPYLEGLSSTSSAKLMQLFSSMSSPSFLLANETNHALLHSLLESISSILENKCPKNPELVFAILKNKKRVEALRSFTLESGQEEIERRNRRRKDSGHHFDPFDAASVRSSVDSLRSPNSAQPRHSSLEEVPEDGAFAIGDDDDDDDDDDDNDDSDDEERQETPARSTSSEAPSRRSSTPNVEDAVPTQLRGMSEKARGKMPAGVPTFSRQNSTTSLGGRSISGQSQAGAFEPSAHWIDSWLLELPLHTILAVIQQVSALLPRQELAADMPTPETLRRISGVHVVGIEPSAPRVHSFEWSQLALGWYESLLWGVIFTTEMQVSRGTMGIWNGTAIKLFRVQETAPEGPTLTSPRGAVDAVGSNIVSRIGQINLRGGPQGSSQAPQRNN
ncbi:hypothetical protein FPRO06_02717 [Fusarium proliferatum]|nr:hypothetical protein FPRO06_02717 [Fusarium proliferatum]